jgi:hypothetical protein
MEGDLNGETGESEGEQRGEGYRDGSWASRREKQREGRSGGIGGEARREKRGGKRGSRVSHLEPTPKIVAKSFPKILGPSRYNIFVPPIPKFLKIPKKLPPNKTSSPGEPRGSW